MKMNNSLAALTVVLAFVLVFGGCKTDTGPSLPAEPTGLVSETKTESTITIAWNKVSGAVKYHVYAGTSAESLTLRGRPTVTSFVIEGLTANTAYYIAVSAENNDGEGKKSAVITVTTNQIVKLAAPSGLAAGVITDNSIDVSWNSVSGVSSYKVFAGTTIAGMRLRGSPTETNFTITGLSANTIYYIAVSARTTSDESEQCTPINVVTKLATPSGLKAGVITDNSIAVSWNRVDGASSYNVFAGATVAGMTLQGSPTETSYTITGLSANTAYYIAVSVLTDDHESDRSTPLNVVTRPAAPAGLAAGTITSNSIVVTWNTISDISGYAVYVGTTSQNMIQRGTPTSASFIITGLTANMTYYIAVSAKNASGESVQSSPITVTTKLAAPTGLTAAQASTSSIQLSWNAVSGAVSYTLYRSSSAEGTYTNIETTTGTSYNDTGLSVATDYYYKVSVLTSENAESDLSDYVLGRIAAQTKAITQFRFADFSVNGTISGATISVTVPNIVNLTTLVPTITHNGGSIDPASDVAQDFTSPVHYTVTAEDGTMQSYTVTVTPTNTTLAAAFTWINNNYKSDRTYTIVAQASESLALPVTIYTSSSVNIILSGGTTEKTISLNNNGSLFTVSYGTLTLENNITLEGRGSNNASLVRLNSSSGKLIMKTGSKIQNNTVILNAGDAFGGGVYIGGGSFTMDGGTISGNKVQATGSSYDNSSVRVAGGGVYFYSGTFIMNSGTISNNIAYSDIFPTAGGGVYIAANRSFTMNGGTISYNTAESSSFIRTSYTYGGGVAAWDGSTFTMTGGTISGNTAKTADNRLGGGVYVKSDKFTKTGGTIYGSNVSPSTLQNTAKDTSSGHAVYALIGSTPLIRNTTAGTGVNMDSSKIGSAGGWE